MDHTKQLEAALVEYVRMYGPTPKAKAVLALIHGEEGEQKPQPSAEVGAPR